MNASDLIRIETKSGDGKTSLGVITSTWADFVAANASDIESDLPSITDVLEIGGKVTLGGGAAPMTVLRADFRAKHIDFADFRRNPKTQHFCCACQKDLKPGQPYRVVHWVYGAPVVLHPAEEAYFAAAATKSDKAGDMGFFPIGTDCAKRLGLEWTHAPDSETATTIKRIVDAAQAGRA